MDERNKFRYKTEEDRARVATAAMATVPPSKQYRYSEDEWEGLIEPRQRQPQIYLANAFSLNMLGEGLGLGFSIRLTTFRTVAWRVPEEAISFIGHEDLAQIVSGLLGRDVPAHRASLTLWPGDTLYVAQYSGPRLAEGTTELPAEATIRFWKVSIERVS